MTLHTRTATTLPDRPVDLPGAPGPAVGHGAVSGHGTASGRARRRVRVRRAAVVPGDGTRHRGDALFPGAAPSPGTVPSPGAARSPGTVPQETAAEPVRGTPEEPEAWQRGSPPGARRRLAALRERTPVWVQTRCGLEPRTLAALTVVLVVAGGLAGGYFWTGRPEPVRAPDLVRAAASMAPPAPELVPRAGAEAGRGALPARGGANQGGAKVIVDVGGKVHRPGVLTLPAGSRVADALRAAGGAKENTDLTGLNRARVLLDGEQVLVGLPGISAPGPGPGSGAGNGGPGVPLSLNTATVEQLDGLPGVGPVLAGHIVDHRTEHGGFRSVGELREVNGIGERRFADLEPLVRP
ncbi:helix-hairpin-helix domain-containing protein [Streptomyces sp. NPDC059247]|uniref:helix-hairpin-helix domain-containing protein n=1 Tax=Streptomyces sp. NPDC059247 TaxID=3346790 RepID=UPI0036746EED